MEWNDVFPTWKLNLFQITLQQKMMADRDDMEDGEISDNSNDEGIDSNGFSNKIIFLLRP